MAGKEPRNTKAVSTKAVKNAEKEKEGGSFSVASVRRFIREVKNEFGKIVWPNRKITLRLAAVVLVMTAVMSLYLGLVDILLGSLVSRIL
jgi:preprotein translocase subunit SecE